MFWPSFNGGLLGPSTQQNRAIINTYFSLCAAVVFTFVVSPLVDKKGRISMVCCTLYRYEYLQFYGYYLEILLHNIRGTANIIAVLVFLSDIRLTLGHSQQIRGVAGHLRLKLSVGDSLLKDTPFNTTLQDDLNLARNLPANPKLFSSDIRELEYRP